MNKNFKKNLKRIILARLVAIVIPVAFFTLMGILYYSDQITAMYFLVLALMISFLVLGILIMTGKYQTYLNPFWKDVLIIGYFERKHYKIWGIYVFVISLLFFLAIAKIGFEILLELEF